MMDGRVKAIRAALDGAALANVVILAYSAKYASAFYGPFREAADSTPQFGDRHSYQMDVANQREALREISLDIKEGADMVMVKPALPYLDVITRARQQLARPRAHDDGNADGHPAGGRRLDPHLLCQRRGAPARVLKPSVR
jgi:porphobilinogen synthase